MTPDILLSVGAARAHSPEELAALGLLSFAAGPSGTQDKGRGEPGEVTSRLSSSTLMQLGPGLAAIPKRLVERIKAGEYIDFMELPPAKGKSRPLTQVSEGQVVVLHASELEPTRKLIPDLATWLQCFALYTTAVTQDQPDRITEMMAYQSIITKASQWYRWPSWVIYDTTFRKEMASMSGQSWARVDPSIYSLSFTGQALASENWCTTCQTLDHTVQTCPAMPRKRPRNSAFAGQQSANQHGETCRQFNRGGECRFGRECRYQHSCSTCGDPHPASRCKVGERQGKIGE